MERNYEKGHYCNILTHCRKVDLKRMSGSMQPSSPGLAALLAVSNTTNTTAGDTPPSSDGSHNVHSHDLFGSVYGLDCGVSGVECGIRTGRRLGGSVCASVFVVPSR
jgi:hypothetical protein